MQCFCYFSLFNAAKPVEQEPKKEVRVVEKESAPAAVPPAPVITEPETAKEKAQPEPEENVSEHEDDADSAPASPPHQEEEAAAEASADDDEEKEEDAADEKDRDEHDDDVMVVDDDHIDEAAEEDAPDIKKDEKKEKEVVPEKKKAPKKKASSKPRHKNTAGKFVDDQAEEEDEEDAADDDDEEDDAAGEPVDENGHAMKQDEDGRWSKFIVDGSSDEEGGAPVAAADEDEDDDVADEEEAAHPAEDGDDSDIDPEVSKRLEQNVGSFFGGWDLNSSGKKNKIIQCALEELAERKHQKTAVKVHFYKRISHFLTNIKAKEPAEKRRKKAPVTKAQVKIDSDKKEEETAAADEAVAADPEPKAEVAAAEEEKDAEEPEDEKKKKRDIPPRKRALPMDLKLGVNLPPDDGDAEKPKVCLHIAHYLTFLKAAEVPVDAKPEIAPAAAPSSQIAGQKKDPFLAEAITFKRFCNMALVAAIIAGFKEVYGNEVQAEPYFKVSFAHKTDQTFANTCQGISQRKRQGTQPDYPRQPVSVWQDGERPRPPGHHERNRAPAHRSGHPRRNHRRPKGVFLETHQSFFY